jgi:alkanesulfonate monooxygenase SsuD/methylene tetrahydromethanopterin reductase-like flavin-dependent oxidoreductase (luciferase family)
MLQQVSSASAVGTVASVRDQVHEFLQRTEADELIVGCRRFTTIRLAVRVTTLPMRPARVFDPRQQICLQAWVNQILLTRRLKRISL